MLHCLLFAAKVFHDLVEKDCIKFLNYMDTSGNGLIEKTELAEFIANGLEVGRDDLEEYASRSETHKLIVRVFGGVRDSMKLSSGSKKNMRTKLPPP